MLAAMQWLNIILTGDPANTLMLCMREVQTAMTGNSDCAACAMGQHNAPLHTLRSVSCVPFQLSVDANSDRPLSGSFLFLA